jgi:hypothetical protein
MSYFIDKYLTEIEPIGSETTDMDKIDEIIDLIEAELDGSEEGEPNKLKNIPNQNPEEELDSVEDDIRGNSANLDEEPDEEDDYPDQYDEMGIASEMVDRTVLEQDSAYQTYFRGVMKKHGIKGIRGLNKEKRSEFFKDVSAGWKSRKKVKESEEIVVSEDYKTHFKSMMKKHGVKNIKDLKGAKKKDFFNKIDASWKSVKEGDEILFQEYKKYFTFMLEECGIEDFGALTEVEQAEFMGLVNEAFQTMNELMQKPGAPIENPMSAHANMLDTMKNRLRPERRARQVAAVKAAMPGRK